MNTVEIIELPKILDVRGNLSFIESYNQIPFEIKRVYWIYDVPGGEARGGHAYKTLHELVIAISGSFDVIVDNGTHREVITLNRSYNAVLIPKMIWRSLENFSTNALCLILASEEFSESDYIRDYETFKKSIKL